MWHMQQLAHSVMSYYPREEKDGLKNLTSLTGVWA